VNQYVQWRPSGRRDKLLKGRLSSSKRAKTSKPNARPKPLLPQVIGIRANSDGGLELVTASGLVDLADEHWTTERLVDELFYCLVKKESEPELVTTLYVNNENLYCKSVDLLEHYESNKTILYRKYIIRAEQSAGTYCNGGPIIFIINLADLTERLKAKLIDLHRTKKSRSTLSYVLHSAVYRIFAMASLSWFYDSASLSHEIKVVIQP
jgi:hypothetical protein